MREAEQQAPESRVYRSRNARLGGVCAGIAEHYDFDPIVIRILVVLLTASTAGLAAIAYAILWAAMPREPESSALYDITPERAESFSHGALAFGPVSSMPAASAEDEPGRLPIMPRLAIAVGLVLLFLVVATNAAPLVSGTRWWQFWPLAVIIVGLCLIVIPVRTEGEAAWHAMGIVTTSAGGLVLPMALGVVSWNTIPYAFEHLWVLLVAALVLFVWGGIRKLDILTIAGSFCVAAFCVAALVAFSVQGSAGALLINMPDGNSLRIALARLGG